MAQVLSSLKKWHIAVALLGLPPFFSIKSERTITRVSRNPTLARIKKRAPSGDFLLIFLCFRPKGPQKNLRETLVTSDTRVSLVKVLPNKHTQDNFILQNINRHPPNCESAPSKKGLATSKLQFCTELHRNHPFPIYMLVGVNLHFGG